jgi:MOSC domain-containing protein YiiM
MKIIALNIGKVTGYIDSTFDLGKVFKSAIDKSTVSSINNPRLLKVALFGLIGDEQADLSVHGGYEKALYAYPEEHYLFWEELTQKEIKMKVNFSFGHFGENLTVSGLTEQDVWVGDIWFVGDTELRVTKLREPCFKFNVKMKISKAAKIMIQTARSGWYLKVIKEGMIQAGDPIKVVHGPKKMSIKRQNDSLLIN